MRQTQTPVQWEKLKDGHTCTGRWETDFCWKLDQVIASMSVLSGLYFRKALCPKYASQSPQAVPPAGDQVFKHGSRWEAQLIPATTLGRSVTTLDRSVPS